jgi:cytochrome P450
MAERLPLPQYRFRPDPPSVWDLLRSGVSDVASVIPEAILREPALQLPGPGAPLVVADPALVREVLNDRDGRFVRDKFMRRMNRRAWGKGLAAAEGADWQAQRRAAAPAFRPQAVEANGAAFAAAAARAAGTWRLDEPVELMQRTATIIADIVFTTLVDGKGAVDTAAVAADIPAYVRRNTGFGNRDLLPLPEAWHDRLGGIAGDPAVQRIRALAHSLAAKREPGGSEGDLIALMHGAGPIEDNIRGLFPAALETTMGGASWALYTLALRPRWQARVAEEARSCGGVFTLDSLPLTRRVVQEVLRLYPPAPLLVRSAAATGELGGFPLRQGQVVSLAIYAMHRHRSHWDNPDAFDPDRFLPERGQHPGWLPFGAGPRVCIAAQFALAEIAVVVARLLSALELTPVDPAPQLSLQVTTRSTSGLNVVARRRSWPAR